MAEIYQELCEKVRERLKKIERPGMDELMAYLEESDYYTAPASARFHNNFEGGLIDHSWKVYRILAQKNLLYSQNEQSRFYGQKMDDDSLAIIGLLHDFCKIGMYERISKRKLDNKTRQWMTVESYGYRDDIEHLGHGEKSVIGVLQYIKLNDLEINMIRWHMLFYEPRELYPDLNRAILKYPQIVMIAAADLESSNLLEKVVPEMEISAK